MAVQYPDKTTGAASASEQETNTVDAFGEMVAKQDRNGTVYSYSYNRLGRMTSDTGR